MLRKMRLPRPTVRFSEIRTGTWVLAIGILVTGCSADIMRFNAPALGLGGATANKAPPPIHTDGSLFEQRPQFGSAPPVPAYTPPASSNRVERSRLADAVPKADRFPVPPSLEPRSNDGRYKKRTYAAANNTPANNYESSPAGATANKITVRRGDTLYMLARRHGVSIATIKRSNGLTSNVIQPGQVLYLSSSARAAATSVAAPRLVPKTRSRFLSDAESYTVRSGDSLYGISRRTGVRVSELKQLNNIRDVRRMRPGMVLRLRGRGALPAQDIEPRGTELGTQQKYADARSTEAQPSPRSRPLSGAAPIILNPKADQRITEPDRRAAPERTTKRTASRRPTSQSTNPDAGGNANEAVNFRWPVIGRIIRGFGKRANGSNNDGINIAVPVGTNIQAAEKGTVAYAGNELKGYGNLILIRHANGYVTAYAHGERLLVRRGDDVRRGQVIAKAGKTGNVTQPQLHFEMRQGAKPIDPMPFLGRM